jgi:F0F1-type ATP synthase assembly protein I
VLSLGVFLGTLPGLLYACAVYCRPWLMIGLLLVGLLV